MPYKVITSLAAILMMASMFVATPAVADDVKPAVPIKHCYQTSNLHHLRGSSNLSLELTFTSEGSTYGKVSGTGMVSFPYPPFTIHSTIKGDYFSPVFVFPPFARTYVNAKGYPQSLNIPIEIPPNLKLTMDLDSTLESGTVNYKYRIDFASHWSSNVIAHIAKVPCHKPEPAKSDAGLLLPNFTNKLKVGGELGWYIVDYSPSTGRFWTFVPDKSGVYELADEIVLSASTEPHLSGTPAKKIWKFKGVVAGKGHIMFQLDAPGAKKPVETVIVEVKVVE